MRSQRPALRGGRGLLTGTIFGLGAVAAHHLAGGESAPLATAVIWPVSVLMAIHLVGVRVRPVRLAVAALATQGLWHLVLALSRPDAAGPSMSHHHHTPGMDMSTMHHGAGDHSSFGMYLAHGSIAVLTMLMAYGADRVILALLAEWLCPDVPRPATPIVHTRPVRPFGRAHVPVARIERSSWSVRGPPAAVLT